MAKLGPETLSNLIDVAFKKVPEFFNVALFKPSRLYAEREQGGGVKYEKASGPRFFVKVKEAIGGTAGGLTEASSSPFPASVQRAYLEPWDELARVVGVASITHAEIEALESPDAIGEKAVDLLEDVRTAMKHFLRTSFMASWKYKDTGSGNVVFRGWIGEITIEGSDVTVPAYGGSPVSCFNPS